MRRVTRTETRLLNSTLVKDSWFLENNTFKENQSQEFSTFLFNNFTLKELDTLLKTYNLNLKLTPEKITFYGGEITMEMI